MKLVSHPKLIAIILVALVLRIFNLGEQSLWLDEFTSIEIASKSLPEILGGVGFDNATPPFYYILLHFWLSAFGTSEFALRAFSVLFDLANVYLLWVISRQILPTATAITAPMLYAVSPFAVYYAQEGRMYTLLVFLCLITLSLLIHHVRTPSRFILCALLLIGTFGVYTHYYFIFFLIGSAVAILISQRGFDAKSTSWIGVLAIVALFFLPWLHTAIDLASSGGQTFRKYYLEILPYAFFRFFAGYAVIPLTTELKSSPAAFLLDNVGIIASYYFFAALLIGRGLKSKIWPLTGSKSIVIAPIITVVLLATLISAKIPMLSERYLISIFPLIVIVMSGGTGRFNGVLITSFSILSLLATSMYWLNPAFGKENWRAAASYVSKRIQTGEAVEVSPSYCQGIFHYYFPSSKLSINQEVGTRKWHVARSTKNFISCTTSVVFPEEGGIQVCPPE